MEGNQQPPPPQPPQQSSPQSSTGNPPPAPDAAHVQYHHLVQQQQQQLQMFWYYKRQEIENAKDFKNHQFPLARIKKIMKADQDVRMVSADAPIVLAKACELFIQELTIRSWLHPEANNRMTLQKNDITATIARTDIFDFLVDVVPRDEEIKDEAAGLGIMPPSTGIVGPPSDGVGPTASAPNSGDDGSNGSAPHTAKNVDNAVRTPWNTEEDEKEIRMWFDMPGLAADNIEVDIVDDLLVIKGDGGIDAFGNKIHSPYDSRLQLPFNAWKEEVTAVFKNGVLYLTVPKILKKQHKMIHIPVRNERQV